VPDFLFVTHALKPRPPEHDNQSHDFQIRRLSIFSPIPAAQAILWEAGMPGDRWAGLRKKAGREESPDTVVFNAKRLGRKSSARGASD
jgi:hypothetical protein